MFFSYTTIHINSKAYFAGPFLNCFASGASQPFSLLLRFHLTLTCGCQSCGRIRALSSFSNQRSCLELNPLCKVTFESYLAKMDCLETSHTLEIFSSLLFLLFPQMGELFLPLWELPYIFIVL